MQVWQILDTTHIQYPDVGLGRGGYIITLGWGAPCLLEATGECHGEIVSNFPQAVLWYTLQVNKRNPGGVMLLPL